MMKYDDKGDILIERLRSAIKQKGLSVERAAPFLEVSFKTLYRWLNYEVIPSRLARKAIRNGLRRIEKIG